MSYVKVLNIDLPNGTLEVVFLATFTLNDATIEVDREGSVMDLGTPRRYMA